MDLEEQVREAILAELTRQADAGNVKVIPEGAHVRIDGRVDLEALAMALVGAVAGGP